MSRPDSNASVDAPAEMAAETASAIERLEQGQAISQTGTWDIDLRTGRLDWSSEMFRVYGLPDDALGRPEDCLATVLPDDRESTESAYANALARHEELDVTQRVQPQGGSIRHVRVRGRFDYASDGTPIRAIGTAQDITQLVTSQSALRESEARLRATLQSMAEGFVHHATDGRVVEVNPAACTILGLSRDEILGRKSVDPRWQSVHEDGTPWPGLEHPAMMALRTGLPQRDKLMGVRIPDAGLRWIRINAVPVLESWGDAVTGVVATFVDVTGHRALEARLSQAVDELADLYENAPCGYHLLDANGRFVRINATELRWLGCERDEVIGKLGPRDFFTDEGRETFRQNFPRLLRGESLKELELEIVGRDGQRRWVSLSAMPVWSENGVVTKARSVLYDISDLHRLRDDLNRVNAEQAAVLATGLIGLVKVRQRRFVWVSDGAARMFGYAPDELVGQPTRVIYGRDADHEHVAESVRHRRESGQVTRFQLEMRRKDGLSVWVDLRSELLSAQSGESLGVFLDVTASKRAEAARVRAAQLAAENAQLMESSRLKNEFLSNMSHELRTPLNAVIGYAQLLQDGPLAAATPRHAEFLGHIVQSGRHLLGLVEQMLDFAQTSAGRMAFATRNIDVREAIADVADLVEPKRVAAGVDLTISVDPFPLPVANDPLRLQQMLLGLLDNAVKFSRPGGAVVVHAFALDADRWCVTIEDQGIGISEADLKRVFQPFVQISAGPTKTHEGVGIGLALVRMLARAQGGDVRVQSRAGVGSVFTLELPRVLPSASNDPV